MATYVTLRALADEFGLDRSNMRKYTLKNGFQPVRIRTTDSGGQLTLALTLEDAEGLRARRREHGFLRNSSDRQQPVGNDKGWFYVVQLVPDLRPNRIKLGFASDMNDRLSAHRTSAPTARVVKTWPCKRIWEVTAIDSITREGCNQLGAESYDCNRLEGVVERADSFFAIMPQFDRS